MCYSSTILNTIFQFHINLTSMLIFYYFLDTNNMKKITIYTMKFSCVNDRHSEGKSNCKNREKLSYLSFNIF